MHKIEGTHITLTRGDTLITNVFLTRNGEPYTPQEGDSIRFALKRRIFNDDKSDFIDANPLVKIVFNDLTLEIPPSATKQLAFGEYVYDMEITFEDGKVDTFIADADFTLAPEVD